MFPHLLRVISDIVRHDHNAPSRLYATVVLPGGLSVVTGHEEDEGSDSDFVALKMDPIDRFVR